MDPERRLLKHFLATLSYRTHKALDDAPSDFSIFKPIPGVRSPQQLVCHMSNVLWYALNRFGREDSHLEPLSTLDAEVVRFHEIMEELAEQIESGTPFAETTPDKLLQGPLADAMTHAGQLAMLRRLAGSPIPPENFHEAAISTDNLSADQPPPNSPDQTWVDAEGNLQTP